MTTELSYRRSSVAGASAIGLMIVLFDTLAGDLRRAAAAIHRNDIETRCSELNHAALVIGQLESWIDLKNGAESARTLSRLYAYLRAKMIEAAGTKSAALLEAQIETILHVRSAWQQLDTSSSQESEKTGAASAEQAGGAYERTPDAAADRVPFSQSA
jgi:flagellar protein FliS